jgi:RNase P subunit RPR2
MFLVHAHALGAALLLLLSCAFIQSASTQSPREKAPHWDLARPAPAIALKPALLDKSEENKCAACHADVVREWASTAHAIAWVDEEYQVALKDKTRPETCYGCHRPKPLLQGDLAAKPTSRDEDPHSGVTCESCHLGAGGTMLGPRGTPTSAHPSQAADVFVKDQSNALCIACHRFTVGPVIGIAKDFVKAKMSARGRSCIGCHSQDVETRFANVASGGSEVSRPDVPVRKGKSHAIQTPRDPSFLSRAFELSSSSSGSKTVVTIKNLTGHRVPGLIGRSIEFDAEALDAAGKVVGTGKLVLDASAYLPVDDVLELAIDAPAARVHVVGRHDDPRATAPVVFLDKRLPE